MTGVQTCALPISHTHIRTHKHTHTHNVCRIKKRSEAISVLEVEEACVENMKMLSWRWGEGERAECVWFELINRKEAAISCLSGLLSSGSSRAHSTLITPIRAVRSALPPQTHPTEVVRVESSPLLHSSRPGVCVCVCVCMCVRVST